MRGTDNLFCVYHFYQSPTVGEYTIMNSVHAMKISGNIQGIHTQILLYARDQGDNFALEKASDMMNNLEEIMEISSGDAQKELAPTYEQLKEVIKHLLKKIEANNDRKFSRGDLVTDEDTVLYMVMHHKVTMTLVSGEWHPEIEYCAVSIISKRSRVFKESELDKFCSEEFLNQFSELEEALECLK